MFTPSKTVRIIDVSPRDGLQNEDAVIPTKAKIALIKGLVDAGVHDVEVGSFVAPRWVPQMADTGDVVAATNGISGLNGITLVPNMKGLEAAIFAGVERIAIFPAATESFSQKNLNKSMQDSLYAFTEVTRAALDAGIVVRGYVSVGFHCPFEGWVSHEAAIDLSSRLIDIGCYEVSICDTTGRATPGQVMPVLGPVLEHHGQSRIVAHFHDTFGQGLANTLEAWRGGIAAFDASTGGLGGCPYSPGATGNVATEDLVYMFEGLGVETGLDLAQILNVAREIHAYLKPGRGSALMKAVKNTASTKKAVSR